MISGERTTNVRLIPFLITVGEGREREEEEKGET